MPCPVDAQGVVTKNKGDIRYVYDDRPLCLKKVERFEGVGCLRCTRTKKHKGSHHDHIYETVKKLWVCRGEWK